MYKINLLLYLSFIVVLASCTSKQNRSTKKLSTVNLITDNKKQGFNPLKHGFNCDSVTIDVVNRGKLTSKLIVSLGNTAIDSINFGTKKVSSGVEKNIVITDFNYDGFCDFVLFDDASASHGGMDYYYFLYDNSKLGYKEIKSLPKFNGGFKLDIKNQRVKIYCPYQDCFAYYKQQKNGKFKLVKGEFKVSP